MPTTKEGHKVVSETWAVSTEHRVIRTVVQWLSGGHAIWLCTIIKTWGASPRPAGSILAFHPDEGVVGSLSGGCIEEELLKSLARKSTTDSALKRPFIYEYEISAADQTRYSLPCGGQLTVLVEHIDALDENLVHFQALLDIFSQRERVRRHIPTAGGQAPWIEKEASNGKPSPAVILENDTVSVSFGPVFKMLLLGAGEVSRCVAQIAQTVDFSVTICEPRESYLLGFELAGVNIVQSLPDDLIRDSFTDSHCAILALAHDPRVDDMALMQALKMKAFYIGAMGSKRTTEARIERLSSLGCTDLEIARLHGPIGYNIGSKKPPEIALSIMAQVLAERHGFLSHSAE